MSHTKNWTTLGGHSKTLDISVDILQVSKLLDLPLFKPHNTEIFFY